MKESKLNNPNSSMSLNFFLFNQKFIKKLFIIILLINGVYSLKAQSVLSFDSTNCPFNNFSSVSIINFNSGVYFIDHSDRIIYRYTNNQWYQDSLMINNNYKARIDKLLIGGTDSLYALTDTAIFIKNGNNWNIEYIIPNRLSNRNIAIGKDSAVWILPTNIGSPFLYKLKNNILDSVNLPPNYNGYAYSGVVDDSLILYYRVSSSQNQQNGLICYDGNSFSRIDTNSIYVWFEVDDQNRLWALVYDIVQSTYSIRVRDNNAVTTLPVSNSGFQTLVAYPQLKNNSVYYITIDSTNNLDINYSNINGINSVNLPAILPINSDSNYCTNFVVDDNFRYWILGDQNDSVILNNKPWMYQVYLGAVNRIKGSVYYDVNYNGAQDSGEINLPNVEISIMPNNMKYYTNQNGEYNIPIMDTSGTYLISADLPSPWMQTSTPTTYNITQSYQGQIDSNINFGFASTPNLDVQLNVNPNVFRAGNYGTYHMVIKNYSSIILDSVELFFDYDTVLNHFQSVPQEESHINNQLKWTVDSVQILEFRHLYAGFYVPTGLNVGQVLSSRAVMHYSNFLGDIQDTIDFSHNIMAPMDPNNKVVNSNMYSDCVTTNDTLDYTINFQNCGNDTAFNVVLVDTLSPILDLSTLHFTGSSHRFDYQLNANVLTINFDSINLVDSNANYYESMGFINYSITIGNYNMNTDSMLLNRAFIYFDFNPAVITDYARTPLCNTVGISEYSNKKSISIYPNPVNDEINIYSEKSLLNKTYKVYSNDGKLIMEGDFSNANRNSINASFLADGFYIIEIEGFNRLKFVK